MGDRMHVEGADRVLVRPSCREQEGSQRRLRGVLAWARCSRALHAVLKTGSDRNEFEMNPLVV